MKMQIGMLFVAVAGLACAQVPAFDVVSVKPNTSGDLTHSSLGMGTGGHFHAENATLESLIQWAFNVRDFQIVGGPSWIHADRFDVQTTATADTNVAQMRQMVQALLADRFRLRATRETRESSVYELVADDSPKVRPVPGCKAEARRCGNINLNPGAFAAYGIAMKDIASALAGVVGRTVVDRTGLDGTFDVQLSFEREGADGPSIFTALQEQAGLKLRAAKGPVEVVVIGSVERPSAN